MTIRAYSLPSFDAFKQIVDLAHNVYDEHGDLKFTRTRDLKREYSNMRILCEVGNQGQYRVGNTDICFIPDGKSVAIRTSSTSDSANHKFESGIEKILRHHAA